MSSIASSTGQIVKSALCFRKVPNSATFSSTLPRSSYSSLNSAKLLKSNNGSIISSSKPFRLVMKWEDVRVKMALDAPASVAYKLYADHEMFPKWMPFLSSVEAMEDRPDLLRYLVKLEPYHFLAKNLQPIPERNIHWRSIEVPHALVLVAFAMKLFMEKLIRGGLESFAAFVKTI